ncbi:MAG: LON peptidase substrate-binding domain-containing protein [Gammaproteobacteria bacterium]
MDMNDQTTIPLFPLQNILFPGGVLTLRIFEPRYLTMISQCMRDGEGFGVCAIKSGKEVGVAAHCHTIGTYTRIVDFDRDNEGLLTVTLQGEKRFKIIDTEILPDQLLTGRVRWLDSVLSMPLPTQYKTLSTLLEQVLRQTRTSLLVEKKDFQDVRWVVARLVELLPFAIEDKQRVLEMDSAQERLDVLYGELLSEVLV